MLELVARRFALGLAGLLVAACNSPRVAHILTLDYGEACAAGGACMPPLVCGAAGVCTPSGILKEGEACVVSLDCLPALTCVHGVCAPGGTGAAGDLCTTTAHCSNGLRCAFASLGGACAAGGAAYRNWPCAKSEDCLAGLLCSPLEGKCLIDWPEPAGKPCGNDPTLVPDRECDTALGFFCDLGAKACVGPGPDQRPVPDWSIGCPDSHAIDGAFRVLFEPGNSKTDYFRLPYPNDARRQGAQLDLTGFPVPPPADVPSPIVQRFVDAARGNGKGFGPNEAVFLRFSSPPRYCDSCAGAAACLTSCMGQGAQAPIVYVVDLTRDAAQSFPVAPFDPVSYAWYATTASNHYICAPYVALWPIVERPWLANHTYAVWVHSRLKGVAASVDPGVASDVAITPDTGFAAMLADSAPADAVQRAAWSVYEPLRAWLASAPTYPVKLPGAIGPTDPKAGQAVSKADVVGGTVFTVRDPTALMLAVATAVDAGAAPSVHDLVVCQSVATAAACTDPATAAFTEVRGSIDLAVFQAGTAPYLDEGGAIVTDASGAVLAQGSVTVPFALSVPDGVPPAGGWPVVVYAHGTGQTERSFIELGLAEALASVDVGGTGTKVGFAVLALEQVAHGVRRGAATLSSDRLFFNLENPAATLGNTLQAAADALAAGRALAPMDSAVATALGLGGPLLAGVATGFIGHSQGARAGVLAMAVAQGFAEVELSGGDALLVDSIMTRRFPFDYASRMPLIAAERVLVSSDRPLDGRRHPLLSLMQDYFEEVDPANFAPSLSRANLGRGDKKNVLQVLGVGDDVTDNQVGMHLARRLGVEFIDGDASGLWGAGDSVVVPPVQNNASGLTLVTSIHKPAAGGNGHEVLFTNPTARGRAGQFFGSAQTDAQKIPKVP